MDLYQFLRKLKNSKIGKLMRRRSFTAAAAVVVFVTTYMLILPAITKTTNVYCGKEEHIHSDACFTVEKTLICPLQESEGHVHSDACMQWTDILVCTQEEVEGHTHDESCYVTSELLICTNEDPEHVHDTSCYQTEQTLVCGLVESGGHTHTEACYEKHADIVCGLAESEGHVHTEACYSSQKVLTCTLEEHIHDTACYANAQADRETESDWIKTFEDVELSGNWAEDVLKVAETQLNYEESKENFIVDETGERLGYTRYGAWYGNEYGHWCAMYIAFCMNYAGVPSKEADAVITKDGGKVYFPVSASCQKWIEKLNTEELPYYYAVNDQNSYELVNDSSGFEPSAGNLIFFNWDNQPDADHIGLVTEVVRNEKDEITEIRTIEGNSADKVQYCTYTPGNIKIMGYAVIPENPLIEKHVEATASNIAPAYLAAEDEISTYADVTLGNAPAKGNASGTNVTAPVLGDWYILYGYIDGNDKYAVGQAISAENPTVQVPLNQVSIDGGTVAYNGVMDLAWQYTENGFRNRNGQYLTIQNFNSNWLSQVGIGTDTTYAGVIYNNNYHILYNTQASDNKTIYNKIYMHAWEGVTEAVNEDFLGSVNQVAAPVYIARLTYDTQGGSEEDSGSSESTADANHPQCAITGTPDLINLTFYSMYASDSGLEAVPGVVYTVYDANGKSVISLATTDSFSLSIGSLPAGNYTVKQTSVPEGYILNPEEKSFTVSSDGYAFIGSFFVYKDHDDFAADKTAQVYDYVNRVYQVDLSAKSGSYQFDMDSINYSLVVDQSNSMLFPAELTETGKKVTFNAKGVTAGNFFDGCYIDVNCNLIDVQDGRGNVYGLVTYDKQANRWIIQWRAKINGTHTDLWTQYSQKDSQGRDYILAIDQTVQGKRVVHNQTTMGWTTRNNTNIIENLNLDKSRVYYVIANENQSSTVYALWHDGNGWIFQDAAYYAKAQFTIAGLPNSTENGGAVTYAQYNSGYSVGTSYGGGDINVGLGGSLLDDIKKGKEFTIYTGSTYNRLHELQQAVAAFATQLASLNQGATLDLVTFDKEVESCYKDIQLNPNNVRTVITYVNAITTSGGTRQERALRHLIGTHGGNGSANHSENHLNDDGDNIVILITDGAPVKSGSDTAIVVNDLINAADEIEAAGVDLTITVGLSMKNVHYGTEQLKGAATSEDWYFPSETTGELTDILVKKILFRLGKKTMLESQADVRDVISDSFYPVDPATNEPLTSGTRIALDGTVDNANGQGTVLYDSEKKEWYVVWDNQTLGTGAAGESTTTTRYYYTDNNGNKQEIFTDTVYYIDYWNGRAISGTGTFDTTQDKLVFQNGVWLYAWRDYNGETNRTEPHGGRVTTSTEESTTPGSPTWNGRIFLKAKEDFIGGNTIDTNKTADVTLQDVHGHDAAKGFALPTPTVNVRLLPIKGFESEETIFLGDEVTDIKEKIEMLFEKTVFQKLVSGTGNNLNYKDWTDENSGCLADTFSIPYAIGRDLTEEDWVKLINGEPVNIPYTYDDDSSHGPVGYFTLQLQKEAVSGETSSYDNHDTSKSGNDVEKYTLRVTYTAYEINETIDGVNRPGNVHNSSGGPGTEVGTGSTLETGKGDETVNEIHHVHVVAGRIEVTKTIDQTLICDHDQTFIFYLTKEGETAASYEVTVIVLANQTTGTAVFRDPNGTEVKRGVYDLSEGTADLYHVSAVEKVSDTTCETAEITVEDIELKFEIGTNESSQEEGHNVIHVNDKPVLNTGNGRYVYSEVVAEIDGERISYGHGQITNTETTYKGEIPVKKIWDDGKPHSGDSVYIMLYQGDTPVYDSDGNAQLLLLRSENDWKGIFTIPLSGKDDTIADKGYSVREVSDLRDSAKDGYVKAIVIGEDNPQIRYARAAEEGAVFAIGEATYKVSYGTEATEDEAATGKQYTKVSADTMVVNNQSAYELPETGGMGTKKYTMGGISLILTALVIYGFSLRRRRERRLK